MPHASHIVIAERALSNTSKMQHSSVWGRRDDLSVYGTSRSAWLVSPQIRQFTKVDYAMPLGLLEEQPFHDDLADR